MDPVLPAPRKRGILNTLQVKTCYKYVTKPYKFIRQKLVFPKIGQMKKLNSTSITLRVFFNVMASGGFYFSFTSTIHSPNNHFSALDTTLWSTEHMIQITCYEIIFRMVVWSIYKQVTPSIDIYPLKGRDHKNVKDIFRSSKIFILQNFQRRVIDHQIV